MVTTAESTRKLNLRKAAHADKELAVELEMQAEQGGEVLEGRPAELRAKAKRFRDRAGVDLPSFHCLPVYANVLDEKERQDNIKLQNRKFKQEVALQERKKKLEEERLFEEERQIQEQEAAKLQLKDQEARTVDLEQEVKNEPVKNEPDARREMEEPPPTRGEVAEQE